MISYDVEHVVEYALYSPDPGLFDYIGYGVVIVVAIRVTFLPRKAPYHVPTDTNWTDVSVRIVGNEFP